MQINAKIEPVNGQNWFGCKIGGFRMVIFSQTEKPLNELTYTMNHQGRTEHLITEFTKQVKYRVRRNRDVIAEGTTGDSGSIYFTDNSKGQTTYFIDIMR